MSVTQDPLVAHNSRWRVFYGEWYFLIWAAGPDAARRQVEEFGYEVTTVEPAPWGTHRRRNLPVAVH